MRMRTREEASVMNAPQRTTSMHTRTRSRRPAGLMSDRGFTIIELLVVIAILFLLITVAFIGLKTARRSADRSVTLNALRQMMTAYSGYTTENGGRLLPGYIKPANIGNSRGTAYNPLTQLDIIAKGPDGQVLTPGDTSSYVWRLAPYLDNAWQTYMADYGSGLKGRYEEEVLTGDYGPGTMTAPPQLGIALTPSIGYNSLYLGGDNEHGDGNAPDYSPWGSPNPNIGQPSIAVTRASEILNPAETIAFATCKAVRNQAPDPPLPSELPYAPHPSTLGEQLGYMELRAPWLPGTDPGQCDQPQWIMDADNQLQPNPANFNRPGGLMVDRLGDDKVPTAHCDGSTVIVNPAEFFHDTTLGGQQQLDAIHRVISRWSPQFQRQYFGR
jgi:prepilin-type N-terminal cleavage/methylation domain-containing protein